MIDGNTALIAHLGYPTRPFKAPMIYNPYFEKRKINAVVMPIGVKREDYAALIRPLFQISNILGALVTMPLKVQTVELLDAKSTAVEVAGSCNAILRRSDGSLYGDMFDGEGFVRAAKRKGVDPADKRILVVGNGGVGSAIAASFAAAGAGEIALFDIASGTMNALRQRLQHHFPKVAVKIGSADPDGFDVVVNATPIGMLDEEEIPVDVSRIPRSALVGDVVMKQQMTPFLTAAKKRGCRI